MIQHIYITITIFILSISITANAQTYEFSQGYIFKQKYLKKISIKNAEKLLSTPDLFHPLMMKKWDSENIENTNIKRNGDRLIFTYNGKNNLSLRDFEIETTNTIEGEFQKFIYLKSTPSFHIIGVSFGHDQPAFLLISNEIKDLYYVDTHLK